MTANPDGHWDALQRRATKRQKSGKPGGACRQQGEKGNVWAQGQAGHTGAKQQDAGAQGCLSCHAVCLLQAPNAGGGVGFLKGGVIRLLCRALLL
jgi:hypothetical protein